MDEHLSEALRLVTEIKDDALYGVFGITRADGLLGVAIEEIKDAERYEKMLKDQLELAKRGEEIVTRHLMAKIEKHKSERKEKPLEKETVTERFLRILRSKNPMVYFLVKDMKIREAGEEEAVAKPCVVFRTNDSSDLGAEKFKMLQSKCNKNVLDETAVEAKCFYMIEDGSHDAD